VHGGEGDAEPKRAAAWSTEEARALVPKDSPVPAGESSCHVTRRSGGVAGRVRTICTSETWRSKKAASQ